MYYKVFVTGGTDHLQNNVPVKVCVHINLNVSASSTSMPEDDGTGEILEVMACTLEERMVRCGKIKNGAEHWSSSFVPVKSTGENKVIVAGELFKLFCKITLID